MASDGVTAKSWHPATNMVAYNEGDIDSSDWDNIDRSTIEIID